MGPLLTWLQTPIAILLTVVHLGVAARAITRPGRQPASRVAWMAVIMSVPVIGVIGYLFLGETSIGPRRAAQLRTVMERSAVPINQPVPADRVPEQIRSLFSLVGSVNGFTPSPGNRIRLLGDPDATAQEPARDSAAALTTLIADIEAAQETVHLCFYIWLDDDLGGRMVEAVCAAARRGVACRVMVDALGSRAFIKSARWRQLRDAGVLTDAAQDDIPRLGPLPVGRVDLRNHRKIAVIDNQIAYCGSQNCADAEFRVEEKFAPWVDVLLRCEGPVARQEQWLFTSTWTIETGEDLSALAAQEPLPTSYEDGALVEMFGTGPTSTGPAMSEVFVATIYAAQRELIITTPYFVPDEAILRALCAAPHRGVETTIVFPARNNSRLVGACGRSTYAALLDAGVTIYEYPLGLLHSKIITIDGEVCLLGSANMDRRSLELNFENNMLVADRTLTQDVKARQQTYLSVSHRVDPAEVRAWSFPRRLAQNTIEMLAPLL